MNSVPCLSVPRGHHRRRCSDAARNLRARKSRSQSCVSSHAVLKKSRCSAAQAWQELEAASRNSAGVTSACLRLLSCTDDMCALPGPVLRLFPPCALVSHARGSSGAVDNMPFAWRGHTKSLTTRARPSPDLAVWLEYRRPRLPSVPAYLMLMAWREGACGWAWWVLTLAMATSWAHKIKLAALLLVVLFLKVASLADVGHALLNVALARPSLIPSLCTRFTRAGIEWRR